MEKLLRILFVMCAIAFVTTLTACADDNKTAKTGGDDKTANTGGDDKPVKTPSIFKFEAADAGVTIDTTKDVYKITINPSLLTYAAVTDHAAEAGTHTGNFASAPAPIFTVTFKDDKQGFIIPTTVAKAEALTTMHITALTTKHTKDVYLGMDAIDTITYSYLAAAAAIFGFSATAVNTAWSTPINVKTSAKIKVDLNVNSVEVPAAVEKTNGVTDIMESSKVRVSCTTTITGPKAASFTLITPIEADDLAIAKGTETVCAFSLVSDGSDDAAKKVAYKAWATEVVKLAKDDATKNIQKMSFVGIVTGDDTASAITKAAGITKAQDVLGEIGFTADASAKLVKAYNSVLQKVEIVIAAAK